VLICIPLAKAAITKNSKLIIKGIFLRVAWAKPVQPKAPEAAPLSSAAVPPGAGRPFYPSMDPERLGARVGPMGGPAPGPAGPAALPTPNWAATSTNEDGNAAKRQRTQQ